MSEQSRLFLGYRSEKDAKKFYLTISSSIDIARS